MQTRSFRGSLSSFRSPMRSLILLAALFLPPMEAHAGNDLLVPVRQGSAVYQKVVVTSALSLLQPNPGEKGPLLDAFSIFYRLKMDDGSLEVTKDGNTYWRVGTPQGEPLGYINKHITAKDKDGKPIVGDAVKEWNTRFVIDPQGVATDDRPLIFLHPKKKDEYFRYEGVATTGKDDNRALAFITGEADEEDFYPVIYYIGKMRSKSAKESTLDDVGIDIAFVLEMTDFMNEPWPGPDGSPTTLQLLTSSVREIARQAERSDKTRGKVALAIVQYQDTKEEQDFVVDVASDFVTGSAKFEEGLKRLRPKEIKGDWPEDGLAGIDTAIRKLKWRPITTKHVILIGSMSLQTQKQGQQVSQWGNTNNYMTNPDGVWEDGTRFRDVMGWSSTGHNLETIVQAARRGGDTDFQGQMANKTLHAILLGKNIRAQLSEDDWNAIDKVVNLPDEKLRPFLQAWRERGGIPLFPIKAQMLQREIAEVQYKELAANGIKGGDPIGLYIDAEPTRQGVEQTAASIASRIEKAFDVLESFQVKGAAAAGAVPGDQNVFTKPLVDIAKAYAVELANKDAAEALAATTDTKGREVGKLKVFVFKKEIKQLESTLNNLHDEFAPLTNRAQRANVADILEKLKRLIAESAAGQVFDENTPLDRIVGDLPLKTPVLSTTAAAIAKMPSEDYSRWVNQLEVAEKRCRDLYENGTWTKQSTGIGEEFGFLEKSRLP